MLFKNKKLSKIYIAQNMIINEKIKKLNKIFNNLW